MSKEFDKDAWILKAIAVGYLIVYENGEIWRRKWCNADASQMSKDVSLVKPRVHKKSGRVYFNMTFLGLTKSVLVNRVIALKFLPNPLGLPQVNHIDGDKEHNYLRQPTPELVAKWGEFQLEWSTGRDNEKHAHRTGLKSGRGSANSNAKLSPAEVLEIRASQDPIETLMRRYDVARSTVVNILNRSTWTHL